MSEDPNYYRELYIAAQHELRAVGHKHTMPSHLAKLEQEQDRAVLCNAMLLTEGYDEPSIDTIVCLRPTRSRALYTQMVGRGTRLSPGKTHLAILDFLWMTGKHKLVKPTRLVTADEVGDIADELISEQGEFDLQDVAGEAVIQRETALAKQLAIKKRNSGTLIDPVEFAVGIHDASLADFQPTMMWHSQPMSFKQEQMLNSYGFDVKLVTCKGHASAIIDRLMTRNHMNLASPKQVRALQRYGVKKAEQWTRKTASEFLEKAFKKK